MPNESDSVLILFMGRQHAHAVTSIQHYAPDAVHIITSDDFRKSYVRRLNDWSKKFGFRKGTVQSVSDLFESTGVPSLLNCVFRVAGHEHAESNGKMETHRWAIGITGGTMHMAAVATTAQLSRCDGWRAGRCLGPSREGRCHDRERRARYH